MDCSVAGCTRPRLARGWCATHYMRWRNHGSTDDPRPTPVQRFAAMTAWDGEHLLWLGDTRLGYGRFWLDGRATQAHRYLMPGAAEPGLQPDHLCRVRACCLPDHLEWVTPRENTRRQLRHVERTTCVHGHAFTPESRGASRRCKRCHANRAAGRPMDA